MPRKNLIDDAKPPESALVPSSEGGGAVTPPPEIRSSRPGSRGRTRSGPRTVDIPYPILTDSPGFSGMAGPSGPAGGTVSSLGLTVETTLREVLGWRPRAGDSRGFVAALTQSFSLQQIAGHTEVTWTPKTYAVQPDMGAVTGAQASLFTRAKAAVDQVLPLLEGLYPLDTTADPQQADAHRAIVRSSLTELVRELGMEGGPRTPRVDSLFTLLLGATLNQTFEDVEGELGVLRDLFDFGIEIKNPEDIPPINTIDEERNLTNFIILVDSIVCLRVSWQQQRSYFQPVANRGSATFLGPQLVRVSRALSVIHESVRETSFAMDSVFLGAAERQLVELRDDDDALSVADLLSWIASLSSEEGPRLIQQGGRAGLNVLTPTIQSLLDWMRVATDSRKLSCRTDCPGVPPSFLNVRVQNALIELREQLKRLRELIDPHCTGAPQGPDDDDDDDDQDPEG